MIVVNEIYGPTFQGEGPSLGIKCAFVRLSACNLYCSWCDTPFTWAFSDALAAKHRDGIKYSAKAESHKMSEWEIFQKVEAMGVRMVVISGGEPLLQQAKLLPLLQFFVDAGIRVEVETNGTIAPTHEMIELVDQFNCSPKLENSGVTIEDRYKPEVLARHVANGKTIFKFVCADADDLEEVRAYVTYALIPDRKVWIMPEGVTPEAIIEHGKALWDPVLQAGWNLTTRMHTLAFGQRRGV